MPRHEGRTPRHRHARRRGRRPRREGRACRHPERSSLPRRRGTPSTTPYPAAVDDRRTPPARVRRRRALGQVPHRDDQRVVGPAGVRGEHALGLLGRRDARQQRGAEVRGDAVGGHHHAVAGPERRADQRARAGSDQPSTPPKRVGESSESPRWRPRARAGPRRCRSPVQVSPPVREVEPGERRDHAARRCAARRGSA